MTELHFLRPWWFLALIPLIGFIAASWRQRPRLHAWEEVCDSHLLNHLLHSKGQGKSVASLFCLYFSMLLMILSLTGPTWYQLPVATYKPVLPRVLVLDMSEQMLQKDLSPDRLSRAKFKLRDLFTRKDVGQFGLVVFTGEPFVVSPLTDDGQTISALLSTLTPDVMPVEGQKLDIALNEAAKLIKQAGYNHGEILVLTADTPSTVAIKKAKSLAKEGINSSILPVRADKDLNPLFEQFAAQGNGQLIPYSPNSDDLHQWLENSNKEELALSQDDDVPLWRDEGRWFLIVALLFLLPVFQRGWLQRLSV